MGMSDYVLQKQEEEAQEIDHMARMEERERCAAIVEKRAKAFAGTAASELEGLAWLIRHP